MALLTLLGSRAIVGSRIDVLHFCAVMIIGMAFICVSVWFLFFRGLALILLSLNSSPPLISRYHV